MVTIVGHGKSIFGKGLGSIIDQCEKVVRFSGRSWQDEKDYGARTDYIFTTSIGIKAGNVISDDVVPEVATCIWNRDSKPILNDNASKMLKDFKPVIIQPFVDWMQMEYRSFFDPSYRYLSRGTVAALWFLVAKGKRVRMVGCDNLMSGRSSDYSNSPPFDTYDQAHNYELELSLIKKFAPDFERVNAVKAALP